MLVTEGLALAMTLFKGIKDAVAAGRDNISDADVDAAIAELDASDQRLTDAIERARAREAEE